MGVLPSPQAHRQPGCRRTEGGDPAYDLCLIAHGSEPPVQIHVCRVDGRVSQGKEYQIPALVQVFCGLFCQAVMALL